MLRAGHDIELSAGGDVFGTWSWPDDSPPDPEPAWVAGLETLAGDLEVLQRQCHVYFPVPQHFSTHDRITVRFLRLLAESHCVIRPGGRYFEVTLTGQHSAEIDHMLNGKPFAIRLQSPLNAEVFGYTMPLREVMYFHTQVLIDGSAKIRRAMRTGLAVGMKAVVRPINGEAFRAVIPTCKTRTRRYTPPPWGLGELDNFEH